MKMSRIAGFGLALTILAAFLWLPQFAGQSDAAEIQMRTSYLVLLKRGPSWTSERSPEVIQVSQGHRRNIDDMLSSGKLALAGPFVTGVDQGEGALAGLLLFDVASKEEAIELAESDPAVVAGRFTIEVHTWYGPKGITYADRE